MHHNQPTPSQVIIPVSNDGLVNQIVICIPSKRNGTTASSKDRVLCQIYSRTIEFRNTCARVHVFRHEFTNAIDKESILGIRPISYHRQRGIKIQVSPIQSQLQGVGRIGIDRDHRCFRLVIRIKEIDSRARDFLNGAICVTVELHVALGLACSSLAAGGITAWLGRT